MKSHEKLLFDILQSELWGRPFDREVEKDDLKRAMKLASSHAVLGLVGNVIMTTPHLKAMLSEQEYAVLRKFIVGNLATGKVHNNNLVKIVMELRKSGIEPVLLKGLGLARFYPHPECRQLGDLDIYVGEENYEKAYDALMPIVTEIDDRKKIWNWMHFDAKIGKVMIEIHQNADYLHSRKREKKYRKYMKVGLSSNLRTLDFDGVQINVPNDNFNAFYTFYHLWRHFSGSGVGLRQFCDLACFLHANYDRLDLSYLKKILKDLDFMKQWQVFGCFLVETLGLPEYEFPFYDKKYSYKTSKVMKYVLVDGNFGVNSGHFRARSDNYLHEKFISLKHHLSRSMRMFIIFPKQVFLKLFFNFRDGFGQIFKDLFKRRR